MLQKTGQVLTLCVTALTLVILLFFVSQYNSFAKESEMKQLVTQLQTNIDTKIANSENTKTIDALNQKLTQLENQNKSIQKQLDDLKKKLNKPKTQVQPTPQPTPTPTPGPIQKSQDAISQIKDNVVVIVPFLNVRNNPSMQADVFETIPLGTQLKVLDKNISSSDGYLWIKVGLDDGSTGYVVYGYVQ